MLAKGKREASHVTEGKIFAVLSYLSILCIIPLIFKKENSFVLQHSKQGLVLFVLEVAIFIIHIILGLWFLKIGMFILGVFSLVGLTFVLQGKDIRLPVVADLADSITL